jgi:asparagine synthase (glutamine-hydrolysing)
MSVQFGRWNFDGQPIPATYIDQVDNLIAPYGPDGRSFHASPGLFLLYRSFCTTSEARREIQPKCTASGAVMTWDGRLDNRQELVEQLGVPLDGATDLALVAAAYEAWDTKCFAKLIGDWAVCVWDPKQRSLLLARDPIGARHLYYACNDQQVIWSSILDPLVLLADHSPALSEEYIATWLSSYPAAHLTPYAQIYTVPPSCLVLTRTTGQKATQYWDFPTHSTIRYRTDAEYEEHFLVVFRESVRRRLRSDNRVLAELSGGMDSSSIVCIADSIIAADGGPMRLDTVSFYDENEPNWNERPFFTKVEQKRGQLGCHIDVSCAKRLVVEHDESKFAVTPATLGVGTHVQRQLSDYMIHQGHRVLLSGIGGDEILGGVPTPVPELADLLSQLRLRTLVRQLVEWSLANRRPILYVLAETLQCFLPTPLQITSKTLTPSWLCRGFVNRNRAPLLGYRKRLRLFGALPSLQEGLATLDLLRGQVSCSVPAVCPVYEKRYPYLDRDFLEFVYSIPREQLIRPRQRRSLMRRALAGIVPQEILNRRRKAFISRRPLTELSENRPAVSRLTCDMISSRLGIVNQKTLSEALFGIDRGKEIPMVSLGRTLRLEQWLRHLDARKLLKLQSPSLLSICEWHCAR